MQYYWNYNIFTYYVNFIKQILTIIIFSKPFFYFAKFTASL